MSENDKLLAFGRFLVSMRAKQTAELYDHSINRLSPIDAIRIKAGQIEATGFILAAFKELYDGDVDEFLERRLGIVRTQEE